MDGALNTIAGYEAMNIIRKGQIRFIYRTFGIAARPRGTVRVAACVHFGVCDTTQNVGSLLFLCFHQLRHSELLQFLFIHIKSQARQVR
jgi:hypothetical protein